MMSSTVPSGTATASRCPPTLTTTTAESAAREFTTSGHSESRSTSFRALIAFTSAPLSQGGEPFPHGASSISETDLATLGANACDDGRTGISTTTFSLVTKLLRRGLRPAAHVRYHRRGEIRGSLPRNRDRLRDRQHPCAERVLDPQPACFGPSVPRQDCGDHTVPRGDHGELLTGFRRGRVSVCSRGEGLRLRRGQHNPAGALPSPYGGEDPRRWPRTRDQRVPDVHGEVAMPLREVRDTQLLRAVRVEQPPPLRRDVLRPALAQPVHQLLGAVPVDDQQIPHTLPQLGAVELDPEGRGGSACSSHLGGLARDDVEPVLSPAVAHPQCDRVRGGHKAGDLSAGGESEP